MRNWHLGLIWICRPRLHSSFAISREAIQGMILTAEPAGDIVNNETGFA